MLWPSSSNESHRETPDQDGSRGGIARGALVDGLGIHLSREDLSLHGRRLARIPYLRPGDWVHGEIEFVDDVPLTLSRTMSDSDVLLRGWTVGRLWMVWAAMLRSVFQEAPIRSMKFTQLAPPLRLAASTGRP